MTTSLLLPSERGEARPLSKRIVFLYLHVGKRQVNKYRKFEVAISAHKVEGMRPIYA